MGSSYSLYSNFLILILLTFLSTTIPIFCGYSHLHYSCTNPVFDVDLSASNFGILFIGFSWIWTQWIVMYFLLLCFNLLFYMSDLPISHLKHSIFNSWTHAKITSVLLKQPSTSSVAFTWFHICCKIALTPQLFIILFQTLQLISISSVLYLIWYLQMMPFFYFLQLLSFIYPTFLQHLLL